MKDYKIQEIANALETAVDAMGDIALTEDAQAELDITILGLIKSLRIAAFNASEKK